MYPRSFASLSNFKLAWDRILSGSNKEYKSFFRHLYPSYSFSVNENLNDLLHAVRAGRFRPSPGRKLHTPKKSGVLRTLTLLTLNDQIVYQAIANFIAEAFAPVLRRHYLTKTFGALYAGKNNPFFFQPWKKCHRLFNRAVERAFRQGNKILADFDLVSFYDLIDHTLLRRTLESRIRSGEVLDLLDSCLRTWTAADSPRGGLAHGLPQGPLPSAFLAECFLHAFDREDFGNVRYLRYVDDIRLLGKRFSTVRRALIKLDLKAQQLGLVPQAQKIEVREVFDIRQELKNIPSPVLNVVRQTSRRITKASRRRVERLLRTAIARNRNKVRVVDETRLRYLLYRLPRSIRTLRLIAPLYRQRPDMSSALGVYIRGFPNHREAAEILYGTLREDPVFDSAAGEYVFSLDTCEPRPSSPKYRRLVEKLLRRSIERSLLLVVAVTYYEAKRLSGNEAVNLVSRLQDQLAKSALVHKLCIDDASKTLPTLSFQACLEEGANSNDPDFSRFCTYALISELGVIPRPVSSAGRLVLKAIGLRRGRPAESLVTVFFREKFRLRTPFSWRGRLAHSHAEAERRCNQLEALWDGDPSVLVMALDTFNDLLVQLFSAAHPTLNAHHRRAAGRRAFPDYGQWLQNPTFANLLPRASARLLECHRLRVTAELAHARQRRTGRPTRRIAYREVRRLKRRLRSAYSDLVNEWRLL